MDSAVVSSSIFSPFIVNIDNIFYGTVTIRTASEKSIELSIDSGHSMQVAAYWLAYADGNANNTKHTDYDFSINFDNFILLKTF